VGPGGGGRSLLGGWVGPVGAAHAARTSQTLAGRQAGRHTSQVSPFLRFGPCGFAAAPWRCWVISGWFGAGCG
jgi:hypothetical protein